MFTEQLEANLTLAAGSTTSKVSAGDVERFRLFLHAWGFEAEVTFSTWPERQEDTPFELLSAPGLVSARLEVSSTRAPAPNPKPDPLVAAGIVSETSVVEEPLDTVSGRPVRRREITLRFADPAQVLWSQHYPCELVANASLKSVIERQVVEGIELEQSWSRLGQEHPLVCLGLGADRGGASFYDFLLAYVDAHGGAFTFDARASSYSLAGSKPKLGSPAKLSALDASRVRTVSPERARHDVRLLDAQAATPSKVTLTNDDSVAGVRRDVLGLPPTPIAFEDVQTYEGARLLGAAPAPHLELELARFPTVSLSPGARVTTPATAQWSPKAWAANLSLRAFDLTLEASAEAAPGDQSGLTSRLYSIEGRAKLEQESDPAQRLPPYVTPEYPLFAEARVVAAGGEEEDRRWQVGDDDRAGGQVYTLDVVLWNAKIVVPFQPDQETGHLFFPAFKGSTVLTELWLHSARLERYLDWGPGVRLPQDGQGDHILLGHSETNETSIAHDYVDGKPQLVVRRFDRGDLQTLTLCEGVTTLQVKEEEFAASGAPTFDVTLQVELARGELTGAIGAGMSEVSGKFGTAASDLSGSIGGASSEVQSSLQSTTGEVGGKIDEAKAELDQLRAGLSEGSAPVSAAASAASAELMAAIE